MFLGQVATQVRESAARITDVRVRYSDAQRFGLEQFEADSWCWINGYCYQRIRRALLLVLRCSGPSRAVPLSSVATIERIRTPDEQYRENQRPVAIVSAEIDEKEAGLGEVVAWSII